MHRTSLMWLNPRKRRRQSRDSILLRKQDNEGLKGMARFWHIVLLGLPPDSPCKKSQALAKCLHLEDTKVVYTLL